MSRKNVLVRWLAVAALVLMAVLATISCANEPKVYTLVIKSDGEPTFRQDMVETSPWMLEEKTRPGYELESITDQHGHKYQPLDIIRINEDLTITYNWVREKCTVSFVSEGESEIPQKFVDKGSMMTIEGRSREGYTLLAVEASDGNEYQPGQEIPVTSDLTLTYKWGMEKCTVSFVSEGEAEIPQKFVDKGSMMKIEGRSREGYTLLAVEASDGKEYQPGQEIPVTSDLTLTYKWGKEKCTVSFVSEGEAEIPQKFVDKGSMMKIEGRSREGYILLAVEASDGNEYQPGQEIPVTSDLTLTYKWGKEKCTVSFVSEGEAEIPQKFVDKGSMMKIEGRSREGYTLLAVEASDGKEYQPGQEIPVTSDLTLTYKWAKDAGAEYETRDVDGGVEIQKYKGTESEVAIPKSIGGKKVKSIGNSAFKECTGLTEITIPDSVTNIGWSVFQGCTGLTEITIPDSVTSIGYDAFDGCAGLETVVLGNGITSLSSFPFAGNVNLKSVAIGNGLTSIDDSAFEGCTGLTSITIPDSVTEIGYSAFEGCTGLTSITIPDSVTEIGYSAFEGCTGLTSIDIPDSVTSISHDAFDGCSGLESIVLGKNIESLSGFNFKDYVNLSSIKVARTNPVYYSSGNCLIWKDDNALLVGCKNSIIPTNGTVKKIECNAFSNCVDSISLTIPKSVTEFGLCAFSGCGDVDLIFAEGTTTINFGSRWNDTVNGYISVSIPSTVTNLGHCFQKCFTIEIDPGNTVYRSEGNCVIRREDNALVAGCNNSTIPSGVTEIGYEAFDGCTGLTSITIPDSVTSIGGGAFYGCTSLASATIGNGVTSIGDNTFCGCENLTSITIPSSVTSVGRYAFGWCSCLTSITIPDSVTSISCKAFDGCSNLESISVNPNNTVYLSSGDCLYDRGGNLVLVLNKSSIHIPDGVTRIGEEVFSGCTGLTSITIPDSVTSIGSDAFGGCTSLTSITIPDSVTSIERETFYNCTDLSSLKIGNGVTSIGDEAFHGCTGLTSITIPDSVTYIGYDAFCGCTSLASIEIPDSVTSIREGAFEGCTGLTSIILDPNNTAYTFSGNCLCKNGGNLLVALDSDAIVIPEGVTGIGASAFYYHTNIVSVSLPSSVTSIGNEAFRGCTGLTSIDIPNNVTSIGGGAFEYCTGLTSITIPDSVTSIGGSAFSGCTGLTSITIPSSVTSIGGWAFENCTGLTSITIPSSVTYIGGYAFDGWTSSQTINIDKTEAEVNAQWDGNWKVGCSATIIYKDSPAN